MNKFTGSSNAAGLSIGHQRNRYSLGGHLATAFNRLHNSEAIGGVQRIKDVVTFNGAGVGNLKTGGLRDALDYFNDLRADPDTMKARLGISIPELADFYDQLRTNLTHRTWDATQALAALQALTIIPVGSDDEILRLRIATEKAPLTQALNEIIALQDQRKTIANYTAGGSGPEANVQISTFLPSPAETPAETFDYRLAVILAGRRADATSLLGGALQAVLGKDNGDQLTNQWDLVGTETTGWPWSAVANSQVHFGTDVPVFIEDQPFKRGNMSDLDLLKSLFLKDHFDQNNFADTHSLVLIAANEAGRWAA